MPWPARFTAASRYLGLMVSGIGFTVLAGGWALDMAALRTVFPGLASMKANTALALGLLGLALWFSHEGAPAVQRRWLARLCAVAAALLGAATLAEYLTGINPGIDLWLFSDSDTPAEDYPGRMAPATALATLLSGLALILIETFPRCSQWFALLALIGALLAMMGYLFGSESLYTVPGFSSIALHTSLSFLLLNAGTLAARPGLGVMSVVTAEVAGRFACRRLLPTIPLWTLMLGILCLTGEIRGYYDARFGLALMATGSIVISVTVVLWVVHWLDREDARRLWDEGRFRLALDGSPYAALLVNGKGTITLVNGQAEALFGYSREELVGRPVEVLVPESVRERHPELVAGYFRAPSVRALGKGRHLTGVRKDGSQVPVEISLAPIKGPGVVEVLAVMIDLSEYRKAEEALRDSEARFRLMVTSIRDYAIVMLDPEGRVTGWNPGAERLKGYSKEEIMGRSLACFYTPEDRAAGKPQQELQIAGELGRHEDEGWRVRKDGTRFWANAVITSIHGEDGRLRGYVKVSRDLSERRRMEEQLRAANLELDRRVSKRTEQLEEANRQLQQEINERQQAETAVRSQLAENQVLLKEIHHRVKNNLQIVWSLLDLQTAGVADPAAAAALRDSQERVKSMALVHQMLYQSGRFARVEFLTYLDKLARGLFSAYRTEAVGLELSGEPLNVDLNTAIPLGLIANELITNSLKHGFPNGRRGQLSIDVVRDQLDAILTITDDGIGLPPDREAASAKSLGLQLVYLLAGQIGADVTVLPGPGTGFRVKFPI